MTTLYQQLTSRFSGLSKTQKILTSIGIGFGAIFFGVGSHILSYRIREKRPPFNGYSSSDEAINALDLSDKIAIVTGANSGVGKQTSKILYKQGCTVIMGCRTPARGEAAKQDILKEIVHSKGSLIVMKLDLGSLQSVRDFVIAFTQKYKELNYLINNAGIMALPEFKPTTDGYESQFAVNHLAHFYLTKLLLPTLLKSKARVIELASSAHRRTTFEIFDQFLTKAMANNDGPSKDEYEAWHNYGISKTSNILFARELHRKYNKQGITACSVHPGWVPTGLARNIVPSLAMIGTLLYLYMFVALDNKKTIDQGAATTLRCVSLTNREFKGGHYYHNCRSFENRSVMTGCALESLSKQYNDYEKQSVESRLWTLSETLITQKGFKLTL